MLRLYLMRVPAVAFMCILPCSCANPTQDYSDFQARIAATTDASADTGGNADVPFDGSVFDEAGVDAFSGTYWGACLEQSYAGDVSKVTYDSFKVTYTKGGDGSISISGTRRGLLAVASNISQTTGDPVDWPSTPVSPSGFFAEHVATFVEPHDGNGFGLDLTIADGIYAFTFPTPDGGCGHFTGKVTSPLAQDVDEICLIHRVGSDGSFTRYTDTNAFHCP